MSSERDESIARLLAMLRNAGGEWSSGVLQIETNGRATSFHQHTDTGQDIDLKVFDWMDDLDQLTELLREGQEDATLVMEFSVSPDSEHFQYTWDLASISPAGVVLDPQYRYPNHPSPSMPRPVNAQPTHNPTDPAALRLINELIAEYRQLYHAIKGCYPLSPGQEPQDDVHEFSKDPYVEPVCTEEQLIAAETKMGLRLPDEVRALYRLVGADSQLSTDLLGGYTLTPLDRVVKDYLEGEPGFWDWNEGSFALSRVVFEAYPFGQVRRVSRNDWWVVFASDYGGNYLAVDLDPGISGQYGQLIQYGRAFRGPVVLYANSVTDCISRALDLIRHGDLEDEEEQPNNGLGVLLPWRKFPTLPECMSVIKN